MQSFEAKNLTAEFASSRGPWFCNKPLIQILSSLSARNFLTKTLQIAKKVCNHEGIISSVHLSNVQKIFLLNSNYSLAPSKTSGVALSNFVNYIELQHVFIKESICTTYFYFFVFLYNLTKLSGQAKIFRECFLYPLLSVRER